MLKSYKTLMCFIVLAFACTAAAAQAAPGEPMKQAKVPAIKSLRDFICRDFVAHKKVAV